MCRVQQAESNKQDRDVRARAEDDFCRTLSLSRLSVLPTRSFSLRFSCNKPYRSPGTRIHSALVHIGRIPQCWRSWRSSRSGRGSIHTRVNEIVLRKGMETSLRGWRLFFCRCTRVLLCFIEARDGGIGPRRGRGGAGPTAREGGAGSGGQSEPAENLSNRGGTSLIL